MEKLAANNIDIADDQPITLLAQVINSPPRNVVYGISGVQQEIPMAVTDQVAKISFIKDGQELWTENIPCPAPGVFELQPGQLLGDAIADLQNSTWKRLLNVQLPKQILAAQGLQGLGQTPINTLLKK